MRGRSGRKQEYTFEANHGFIFAMIKESNVLFIGRVDDF